MTLPREVRTPKDVATFFKHITRVESINFHPDERFHTYGSGDPRGAWRVAYTVREADLRDRLMEQSFTVCSMNGLDIYCMAMWALETADPRGGGPEGCEKERKYFTRKKGVLDWRPPS